MDAAAAAENAARQAEEIEALQAIYGEDAVLVVAGPEEESPRGCCVSVRIPTAAGAAPAGSRLLATLRVSCPVGYPTQDCPVFEVRAAWLGDDERRRLAEDLERIYGESGGEVVLYDCVEHLREVMGLKAAEAVEEVTVPPSAACEAAVAAADSEEGESAAEAPEIYHGEPFVDRKSTFQAHVARVGSVEEVEAVMAALLADRKVAKATHNIMAYRIERAGAGNTFLADNDEDGEQAAGGRMAHLLEIMDARNVVVVVSRWFGGVLLGPDRFKHINNCARAALEAAGLVAARSARARR